jgi:hypothetical protein
VLHGGSHIEGATGHRSFPVHHEFPVNRSHPTECKLPTATEGTDWHPVWRVTEQEQAINFGVELWILNAALDPRLHSTLPAWTMRGRGTAATSTRDLRASTLLSGAGISLHHTGEFQQLGKGGSVPLSRITLMSLYLRHSDPLRACITGLGASDPAIRHSPVGWYYFPFVFFLSSSCRACWNWRCFWVCGVLRRGREKRK